MNINKFIIGILFIIGLCFCSLSINKFFVYLLFSTFIIYLYIKYININKKTNMNKQGLNNLLFIIFLELFYMIKFVLNSSYKYYIIYNLNIIVSMLIYIIIYQTLKKYKGLKIAYKSSFLSIILIFIGYINNINNPFYILTLFPVCLLYLQLGYNLNKINNWKNHMRLFLIIILIAILTINNKFFIFLFLIFLIEILINKIKTNPIKVSMLILYIIILELFAYIVLNKILFINMNFEIININIFYLLLSLSISTICRFKYDTREKIYINSYIFLIILLSLQNKNIIFCIIPFIVLSLHFYEKIKKKPIKKVSVIIPNYNYGKYIIERINSILCQNYPIYELIILDDCSKDNSVEIIKKQIDKIKKKYPKLNIHFYENKNNSGNVFIQWEKAFKYSTGDYIWIAEADDVSNKKFLDTVMQTFDDDVILSYTESTAIDEQGKTIKKDLRDWIDIYNCGRWRNSYITSGKDELKKVMCINNTIANVSSVVFKNDANINFKKYLKEAQKFKLAGDWYFYSKVLLHGKIAYNSKSLNYHRMHNKGVTLTTDNFQHYNEIVKVQKSIMKDVKISIPIQKRMEDRLSKVRKNLCISNDEIYYYNIDINDLTKEKNIKDEILLSIIIPVYNTENYLKKCFESFINTIPIKTEIIIINDGSPDNSDKIIKPYIEKYKNINYIKKENGGLSSVKNLGLKVAKGKYITYLDSDDYVSSNMYSTMLKKALDTDSDIVYCDIMMEWNNGKYQYCSLTNYNKTDKLEKVLDNPLMCTSCNKIVKKEIYNNLTFPKNMNNEDVAVTPTLIMKSQKIEQIPSPFYKYVQRDNSIQNSSFSDKRLVIFDTVEISLKKNKDCNYIDYEILEASLVNHQLLAVLIYIISRLEKKERRKYIIIFCEKFNKLNINYNNVYIYEFLNQNNMIGLLDYIKKQDYICIEKLLRRKK